MTETQQGDDTAVFAAVPPEDGRDGPAAVGDAGRDDGLAAELARAAPRRWWNRGTLVLGALALVVGGFLGGVHAQKSWGTTATPAGRTGFAGLNRGTGGAAGYPGFAGGGQRPGGAAPTASAAAAGTTGTVQLVDGGTLYLKTADGAVVTVKTTGKTSVRTSAKGALKDVKAGETVTVQGAAGSDGTVTATAVTAQGK